MLKDLSISKKLVLSFSLFFMMLLSLGGMSFSLLSGAEEKFHITSTQIIPEMLDSAALKQTWRMSGAWSCASCCWAMGPIYLRRSSWWPRW